MYIQEITEAEKDSYNQFVASSDAGSFLQSWVWGEWQMFLGRQVERLKIKNQNEEMVGAMQVVKMPLPFGKFYWYCPYGPVVSDELWVTSDELMQIFK
jgi:lipid II:glycine glycyltransferase (peptidoglycan interpeptide bridge formation enzyme)